MFWEITCLIVGFIIGMMFMGLWVAPKIQAAQTRVNNQILEIIGKCPPTDPSFAKIQTLVEDMEKSINDYMTAIENELVGANNEESV